MTKIAIIAAGGKAGTAILEEALQRDYDVTAIVRHPEKVTAPVRMLTKDLFELTTTDLAPFEIVVDAFNAPQGKEELHQTALKHLTDILAGTHTRLIIVGGAGSLFVDNDRQTQLVATPDFPDVAKATSLNMAKALTSLKLVNDVDWLYISPSAFFNPKGVKTGKYQVGTDILLTDTNGQSEISYADYAVALVDQFDRPVAHNQQITICSAA